MKREILFRGKEIQTGEWIEGYYTLIHGVLVNKKNHVKGYRDLHCIFNGDMPRGKMGYWHEVDPASVGQYVDTKDKTGRKVFEGDIVDAWSAGSHTTHGLVKWGTTGFFICRLTENGPIEGWNLAPHSERMKGYELIDEHLLVIGNVIDNPELLPCEDKWKEF